MTSPSNGFLSKDYHRDNFKCLLTTDLNWLLSELLGTILSPNKFLNNKKICSDGYVSQQSLKCAFKGFKEFKDFEDLVQILDHYKVIQLWE